MLRRFVIGLEKKRKRREGWMVVIDGEERGGGEWKEKKMINLNGKGEKNTVELRYTCSNLRPTGFLGSVPSVFQIMLMANPTFFLGV